MTEREIPPPPGDPGAAEVDDHVVVPFPRGIGHQPTGTVDDESRREQLTPSWQGARPEPVPDPDRDAPTGGDSESQRTE
jgi:hypothetical protein